MTSKLELFVIYNCLFVIRKSYSCKWLVFSELIVFPGCPLVCFDYLVRLDFINLIDATYKVLYNLIDATYKVHVVISN